MTQHCKLERLPLGPAALLLFRWRIKNIPLRRFWYRNGWTSVNKAEFCTCKENQYLLENRSNSWYSPFSWTSWDISRVVISHVIFSMTFVGPWNIASLNSYESEYQGLFAFLGGGFQKPRNIDQLSYHIDTWKGGIESPVFFREVKQQ